jgi:hypothetical protein
VCKCQCYGAFQVSSFVVDTFVTSRKPEGAAWI